MFETPGSRAVGDLLVKHNNLNDFVDCGVNGDDNHPDIDNLMMAIMITMKLTRKNDNR